MSCLMMNKCPFCGGEGYIYVEEMDPWEKKHLAEVYQIDENYYYGECKECGASTGS